MVRWIRAATEHGSRPTKSVPRWIAWMAAVFAEGTWRFFGLKSAPFATKTAIALMGQEITLNDAKARQELGYEEKMVRPGNSGPMRGDMS